jgi:hypothetical protein
LYDCPAEFEAYYFLDILKGSGKTSMMPILVSEMIEDMELPDAQAKKWTLFLDAKSYLNNFSELWNQITKFADRKLEKYFIGVGFRVVVIDNFDVINPANQQGMYYRSISLSFIYAFSDPRCL